MTTRGRSHHHASIGATVLLGTAALLLAGCANSPSHEKNVNAANERWKTLRSGMFIQMAQQRFDAGDLDEAENQLLEALSVDPENPQLFLLSGRIALERGQLERAFQRLSRARELDDTLAQTDYYLGVVQQRWSRPEEALKSYQAAFDLEPDNVSYLLAVAEMMVASGQDEAALTLLQEKLTYFDQNAAIQMGIARIYSMQGRRGEAMPYYEQAAMLRPDDRVAQEELALAAMDAQRYEQALGVLISLTNEYDHTQRPDLHRALAATYGQLGQADRAREIYLRLVRADRADAESWIRMGQLLWSQSDLTGALEAANRAIEVAPTRFEGPLLAGMVWQKRGRVDRALQYFDEASRLAPTSSVPLILRGLALQEAGRIDAARTAYEEAMRRDPEDARARQLWTAVSPQP